MANGNGSEDTNHDEHGRFRIPQSSRARTVPQSPCANEPRVGAEGVSGQVGPLNHIHVFLDRTFRMIENSPDDVVCWSEAGDSFIVKKVTVFQGVLPSYFNHKTFLSFVRQLNFYGFKKVNGGASSRLSHTIGGTQGVSAGAGAGSLAKNIFPAAGAAAKTESESWAEFRHPQFRRGRRDLLVGIKRQANGHQKRKRVDSHKSDILSDLRRGVDALRGDLRTVNDKLDEILLLLGTGSTQGQPHQGGGPYPNKLLLQPQNNSTRATGAAGAGDGGRGDRGTQASFVTAAPPVTAVRGGAGGFGLWGVAGGQVPFLYGAPIGNYVTPRLVLDKQQRQQQTRPSKPEIRSLSVKPGGAPPDSIPSDATDTTNSGGSSGSSSTFSGSAPAGRSQVPPPRVSKNLSPSEHKQGGRGKNTPHVLSTNRGGRSGEGDDDGGEVGASSSVTDDPCDADLRDARQPQQQQRTQQYPPSTSADIPPGTAGGGGVGSMRLLPSIDTLISRAIWKL